MFDTDPKIVAFGGGTGLSVLLRGIKKYPLDLTAVVSVADDGGSSGKMREIFNMPSPGDIRKVLVALSNSEEDIDALMNYRFKEGADSLKNHTVGNIILAALSNIYNQNLSEAIQKLSQVLNINGRVLPISKESLHLVAEFEDGKVIKGESNIPKYKKKIDNLYYDNEKITLNDQVIEAINEAEIIILSQGSLFTSLLPNLIFDEVKEALENTDAKIIYIANLMTQAGETDKFTVADRVKTIEKFLGEDIIDIVIANDLLKVSPEIIRKYKKTDSELVKLGIDELVPLNKTIYTSRLITIDEKGRIRHNYKKLAAQIFSILLDLDEE